jgi:MoaA/NifB/PqqE/SkfB family radical SAM enzyme
MKIPTGHPTLREVRIENTNLCGFDCFFCPREKMSRKKGVQSISDFNLALDRVEEYTGGLYEKSVHLHGYGEPLLDKNFAQKVKTVSTRWPKAESYIVTTLGYKLADGFLQSLIDNGLKKLNVSFYGSTPESYKFHTTTDSFQFAYDNLMKLVELNDANGNKMKITVKTELKGLKNSPLQPNKEEFNQKLKSMNVVVIENFALHNYGDGRLYNTNPQKNLCSVAVKRDILQVTWDLNVIPCCFDYNAAEILGNIRNSTIKEVLDSEKSQTFLSDHCSGKGDNYGICKMCTQRYLKDTP